MKNILLTLIISTTILSCKKENNYENDAELCEILVGMYESDQRIRSLPEMTDPFFEILDSIKTANNLTREDYAKLTEEEQLNWGKVGRKIADRRPKISKEIKDSLWNIQSKIDYKNTKLLIDITKKRGWISSSKDELGCDKNIAFALVFRHAPEEFWNELKPLIDKEYIEKRMGSGAYGFIDNHIRGRPMDFNFGNKKEEIKIKTE